MRRFYDDGRTTQFFAGLSTLSRTLLTRIGNWIHGSVITSTFHDAPSFYVVEKLSFACLADGIPGVLRACRAR